MEHDTCYQDGQDDTEKNAPERPARNHFLHPVPESSHQNYLL
jgi:hypothetical protein